MPKPGKTSAGVMPLILDDKKYLDKKSQEMIDKIRKEHSNLFKANRHKEYNPNVDQQRVWSERSDIGFKVPYESLGRENHLNHQQIKSKKISKK